MSTKYIRSNSNTRGAWTEQQLRDVIAARDSGTMGVNVACETFGVPKATLIRRRSENFTKRILLGPPSTVEANKKFKKLQKHGFAPTRDPVSQMAFYLAEQLNLKLSVRKAEGVSLAWATSLNRNLVSNYFDLLKTIVSENNLFDKPGHIYITLTRPVYNLIISLATCLP